MNLFLTPENDRVKEAKKRYLTNEEKKKKLYNAMGIPEVAKDDLEEIKEETFHIHQKKLEDKKNKWLQEVERINNVKKK